MKKENTESNANNSDKRIRRKSFGELRQFIDACLKDIGALSKEDRQFATTNKSKLLEYAKLLESKIPKEPVVPVPSFTAWQPPSTFGTDDPVRSHQRAEQFRLLERRRYEIYLKEKQQYESLVATIVEGIGFQRKIAARIVSDIEHYHKQPAVQFGAKRLNWRLLPPGTNSFSEIVNHFEYLAKHRTHIEYDIERLHKVHGLRPDDIYIGTEEFEGYIVFYFRQKPIAVLECPVTGNAIYLFSRNWETLSRLSKSELLNNHSNSVIRIVHNGEWFSRLKSFIPSHKVPTFASGRPISSATSNNQTSFAVRKLKRR